MSERLPIDESFDTALADSLSARETYNKHLFRPNTYLHKWWARRCGSTFRLLLKGLVTDPEHQDYYAPGGLEGKVILDPMMGGGTTLHEAIRMGAATIGVDIDPIPVLQTRASLSAEPNLEALEAAFAEFVAALQDLIGPWFATACPDCGQSVPVRFTLWGVRKRCDCGEVIVADSLDLRHEPDGSVIRLCPACRAVGKGQHLCSGSSGTPIVTKQQRMCPDCRKPYQEDLTIPYYRRFAPLAITGRCSEHGVFWKAPEDEDLRLLARADAARPRLPAAAFAVEPGPKSSALLSRGVTSYADLFSSRQLLYLDAARRLLAKLEPGLRLNLTLLVSTSHGITTGSGVCRSRSTCRGRVVDLGNLHPTLEPGESGSLQCRNQYQCDRSIDDVMHSRATDKISAPKSKNA